MNPKNTSPKTATKKKVTPEPKANVTVTNCTFNVDAFKKQDMETLNIAAKALLNITEFYKGTTVHFGTMLSIGADAIDEGVALGNMYQDKEGCCIKVTTNK